MELAERQTFDILVSDVVMPRMNGQELLEQFHKIHPKVPALLISGYTGKALGITRPFPPAPRFCRNHSPCLC